MSETATSARSSRTGALTCSGDLLELFSSPSALKLTNKIVISDLSCSKEGISIRGREIRLIIGCVRVTESVDELSPDHNDQENMFIPLWPDLICELLHYCAAFQLKTEQQITVDAASSPSSPVWPRGRRWSGTEPDTGAPLQADTEAATWPSGHHCSCSWPSRSWVGVASLQEKFGDVTDQTLIIILCCWL